MELELATVHLTVLLVTAIAIIWADHEGISYLRGMKKTLDPVLTKRLHYAVWAGLIGMIGTGTLLFARAADFYLTYPPFLLKMCMVAALCANAFLIGKLSAVSTVTPFAELSTKTKRLLFVSGAISTGCWLGAAFIGYFIL